MPRFWLRWGALVSSVTLAGFFGGAQGPLPPAFAQSVPSPSPTPIKHLVVIFQENVSFDHYFATYPTAINPAGEPAFTASAGTPSVSGLSASLLSSNPNSSNPFRLSRDQAVTCDQDHVYTDEQKAFDGGLMDKFVEYTQGTATNPEQYCPTASSGGGDAVMGYYDGNTVTAIWNYAQNFAMDDNSFGTTFGPSTPGALNLSAGGGNGVVCGPQGNVYGDQPPCGAKNDPNGGSLPMPAAPGNGSTGTMIGDAQPYYDVCSAEDASALAVVSGKNIGDLLNSAGVTWGWFQGGFGTDGPNCSQRHAPEAYDRLAGSTAAADTNTNTDFLPHHDPFQYFAQTANPTHLPPSSAQMIGKTDQASHQYDLSLFWQAVDAGNLPAISFLKAPAYQDGHAGYSDPLDEQEFLVKTINHLEKLPAWNSTAVVILYDDSDGWYDHVASPSASQSNTSVDVDCGSVNTDDVPARCGFGPRLPLLVVSGFAKKNYVSHVLTDQSSVIRFVEDNWLGGQRVSSTSFDQQAGSLSDMFDFSQSGSRTVMLDPATGLPVGGS